MARTRRARGDRTAARRLARDAVTNTALRRAASARGAVDGELVDACQFLVGELEVLQRVQVLLELVDRGSPDQCRGHRRVPQRPGQRQLCQDRKSTRLNSSHVAISYAVFCLKKKNRQTRVI